jgi:hypothetical protein
MSTALLDDKLLPGHEFQQFLSRHPEIMDDVEHEKIISHKFDLPYGAGYSLTGNRIYIDRHVPLIWPMKRLTKSKTHVFHSRPKKEAKSVTVMTHIVKYPVRHESFESACIRLLAMDYETAHHHAVRAEQLLVTSDDYEWELYENQWKPLIKADEVEKIERVPPDLDLTPYEDTPLHAILSDRMRSTKKTARGKFLKAV